MKRLNFNTIISSMLALVLFTASATALAKDELSQTASNEALVVSFYNKIFNDRENVKRTAKQYLNKNYIQHNPGVPTGRQGFIDAISNWLPYVPEMRMNIKRVISDGNIVILHVHMFDPTTGTPGAAIIEMFRVKRGKIVEHWDVVQTIPEYMAHDNGMF